MVVEGSPGSVIVGARFRPGAGGAALGLPLSALRDLRAPADRRDAATIAACCAIRVWGSTGWPTRSA
ncbi:MAG: hypothetical protein AVDCRST_MAG85-2927 [uncultured Solirubrobacteraceae bacterium]|uniref:Uncharacterized protein n=1 Tax=uncultured Solirubrobacteraceae bacterium TaxID=1162706 RepID=A0A6J4TFX3_9ACTN|nr:MAG: hypothetical protein AVDCRST_MAG85-2927 [uncultured Solirubrobacteraceae bacterium]